MVIYRGINCLFDLGVSPASKPSQRKNQSHLVEVQKVNPKTLHRKIQPTSTSSIIFYRCFSFLETKITPEKSGVSQPPKRDHNLQGLSFFSLRQGTHHFSWSWVFHWGTRHFPALSHHFSTHIPGGQPVRPVIPSVMAVTLSRCRAKDDRGASKGKPGKP